MRFTTRFTTIALVLALSLPTAAVAQAGGAGRKR